MKEQWLGLDIETMPNMELWDNTDIYPAFEEKDVEYKVGNLKDPEKIAAKKLEQDEKFINDELKRRADYLEKKRKKFSIDPNLCEVVCVCLFEDTGKEMHEHRFFNQHNASEKDILRDVWNYLLDSTTVKPIVTKNGRMFDIPVLLVRSQILGILSHEEVQRIHNGYLGREHLTRDTHIDIAEHPGGKAALDVMSIAWLGEKKIDISKNVQELVEAGKIDEVVDGCSQHSRLAYQIAQKMMLI